MKAGLILAAIAIAAATVPPVSGTGAGATPRVGPDPFGIIVRADPDGGRTLLLNVEDVVGGTYEYLPVQPAGTGRETGAFAHTWHRAGVPFVALGVYANAAETGGLVRAPILIVEGASSTTHLTAVLLALAAGAQEQAGHLAAYASEILLPELDRHFAAPQRSDGVSSYRNEPPLYVWTTHRSGPAGEVWAGQYLARAGSYRTDAAGNVRHAVKDAETGAAVRVDDATVRVAGVYLTQTLTAEPTPRGWTQTATATTGAAAADGTRVPLAVVRFEDARQGGDLATAPRVQRTGAAVGVVAGGAFVPLAGVSTDATYRPSANGQHVARVTSVGAYADGRFVPVAGARYWSDTGDTLPVLLLAALAGPGSPAVGDFGVDVGTFATGAYEPRAGIVYRSSFREALHPYQTSIAAGAYTEVGFVPLVVATYDGTLPFAAWAAGAAADGGVRGERWRVAAGTSALGSFVPIVGAEGEAEDPMGTRAERFEIRVGVFPGTYRAFIPIASIAFDGDATPAAHAARAATMGPGADAGAFDVRLGAYADGDYVPLAGGQYRSHVDDSYAAETWVIAGAYAARTFVPIVGVGYQGEEPLAPSFRDPRNLDDDRPFRVTAGIYAAGTYRPVLTVRWSTEDARITPL